MAEEIIVPDGYEVTCPACGARVDVIDVADPDPTVMFGDHVFVWDGRVEVTGRPCNHIINGAKIRRTDGRPLTDPPPETTDEPHYDQR